MIIVRSPLRISLGGGGTDLPSYYKKENGFVLSAAINKYVYVTITRPFSKGIYLKYSEIEKVTDPKKIKHKIIREALLDQKLKFPQIEITKLTYIPTNTGLGSSGSFTTALIKAINCHKKKIIDKQDLAKEACRIEINKLRQPIGKQDQYISAYGGINSFEFFSDEKVKIKSLELSNDTISDLEDNLLLFFTGFSRSASEILKDQDQKSKKYDKVMFNNLNYIKKLGLEIKKQLLNGNTYQFGKLMNDHWSKKKNRSNNITNKKINELYEIAIQNGAVGGKLVGAGGGGFLMFYAKDSEKLKKTMKNAKLEEVRFKFDFEGVKQIL